MGWKDKMKEWGGGEITFLSVDGECITFIVIGDPILIVGKFKGKETERIGCPAIDIDGFTLLMVGKRLARRLSKFEGQFKDSAFTIVRRGKEDDIKTKYDLTICPDAEFTQRLFALATEDFDSGVIDEAVAYAQEVANN